MKFLINVAVLALGLVAVQAQAACEYPIAPGKFPDGTVASKDEMKTAKSSVVKYNDEMNAYLTCIRTEYDAKVAALVDTPPADKANMDRMQGQKENAAIKEVTDVTERFNEQLRAWKAKNATEKKAS